MDICVHNDNKSYDYFPDYALRLTSVDRTSVIRHSVKPNDLSISNRVWSGDETVYWQLDSDYEWISKKNLKNLIKLSFLQASFETPLVIRQKRRLSSDAQIIIKYLHKKDERFFRDRPSVLAFAYGPSGGIGGDITMNADRLWLLRDEPLTVVEAFEKGYIDGYDKQFPNSTVKYYDPQHTHTHEGGHALGMPHITDINQRNKAVMYPFYNGLRIFGEEDLNILKQLYGKASLNHKIKEYLIGRILKGISNI